MITTLPTELLIAVFQHTTHSRPTSPLALRAVCHRWQHIVDASPTLWRTIYLDTSTLDVGKLQQFHRQATLFLTQSIPLSVDVHVNTYDADCVLPLLSPLLPSLARWRTFTLRGYRDEDVDMTRLPTYGGAQLPLPLECLALNLSAFDEDEPDLDIPFLGEEAVMQLTMNHLPQPSQLVPLHFTHLTITEGVEESSWACPPSILGILSACPALRVFVFIGWLQEEGSRRSHPPYTDRPVHLAFLETLKIKTTSMVRPLLSAITAPHLTSLSVTYVNVAYAIEGADLYGQEGESEDESHDFSQSPWSDRATGLGLRSFLSRSRPPLRALQMDYSDLRTKDFRWVFDHLPTLESFRIVASDMSDKVIRLLKPEPLHDGVGRFPPREGRVQMRLPRLSRLELIGCQRLTGEAIAAALLPRVIFTDSTSDTHLFQKFQQVCIHDCVGLDFHHESLLRSTLGPRFSGS